MPPEILNKLILMLAPKGFTEPSDAEAVYPHRDLQQSALVTRIAPSPTGFVHLGTVYAALINQRLAKQSGGLFLLRIEDTDKSREVAEGQQQILNALDYFGLPADESPANPGSYGPYVQSERIKFYLGYTAQLLSSGRAYPCFASKQELEELAAKQKAAKVRPGYYGQYAIWRGASADKIEAALAANLPFVLRFLSNGDHQKRFEFTDALKGTLSLPENDLDVPLIKSDGLPTYHLAHVVDDHLMRVNLVMRGDEWLPSVPLHIELAKAVGIKPHNYAHFAPISILDNGKKRKLSKRKDPEADISHWQAAGYPPGAVLEYLTTLASSDFEAWRQQNPLAPLETFELKLSKLAMSRAPLLDPKKLDDISRNVIADMSQPDFERRLRAWVSVCNEKLHKAFEADPDYTSKVLTIERDGANRRKDLSNWAQAEDQYGYFFDDIYKQVIDSALDKELGSVETVERKFATETFLASYNPSDDQPTWLQKLREASAAAGYASDKLTFKANPAGYKGLMADFAKILRVYLTAKNRTPDLFLVMQIMGEQRVRERLSADL